MSFMLNEIGYRVTREFVQENLDFTACIQSQIILPVFCSWTDLVKLFLCFDLAAFRPLLVYDGFPE